MELSLDGFISFEQVRKVVKNKPVLTVHKSGRLGLNKKAFIDYLSGKYVKFFYNSDTKIIALKIFNQREDNTYKVKKSSNSETGFINSTGFFKHNKIDTTIKRTTEWLGTSDNNSVIYIKIKNG